MVEDAIKKIVCAVMTKTLEWYCNREFCPNEKYNVLLLKITIKEMLDYLRSALDYSASEVIKE